MEELNCFLSMKRNQENLANKGIFILLAGTHVYLFFRALHKRVSMDDGTYGLPFSSVLC